MHYRRCIAGIAEIFLIIIDYIHTASGAHTASYKMADGCFLPGNKAAWARSWPHTPIWC